MRELVGPAVEAQQLRGLDLPRGGIFFRGREGPAAAGEITALEKADGLAGKGNVGQLQFLAADRIDAMAIGGAHEHEAASLERERSAVDAVNATARIDPKDLREVVAMIGHRARRRLGVPEGVESASEPDGVPADNVHNITLA